MLKKPVRYILFLLILLVSLIFCENNQAVYGADLVNQKATDNLADERINDETITYAYNTHNLFYVHEFTGSDY